MTDLEDLRRAVEHQGSTGLTFEDLLVAVILLREPPHGQIDGALLHRAKKQAAEVIRDQRLMHYADLDEAHALKNRP